MTKYRLRDSEDGYISVDERFWDCECEENYIHPLSDMTCMICGTEQEFQPPSRSDEVITHLMKSLEYSEEYINDLEDIIAMFDNEDTDYDGLEDITCEDLNDLLNDYDYPDDDDGYTDLDICAIL